MIQALTKMLRFPVVQNSAQRGNVAENGGAAQKAAEPMRVADFSVKGTEQPSPSVASFAPF